MTIWAREHVMVMKIYQGLGLHPCLFGCVFLLTLYITLVISDCTRVGKRTVSAYVLIAPITGVWGYECGIIVK